MLLHYYYIVVRYVNIHLSYRPHRYVQNRRDEEVREHGVISNTGRESETDYKKEKKVHYNIIVKALQTFI